MSSLTMQSFEQKIELTPQKLIEEIEGLIDAYGNDRDYERYVEQEAEMKRSAKANQLSAKLTPQENGMRILAVETDIAIIYWHLK